MFPPFLWFPLGFLWGCGPTGPGNVTSPPSVSTFLVLNTTYELDVAHILTRINVPSL